jgi:Zn-dependent alcohol dehydrogenase
LRFENVFIAELGSGEVFVRNTVAGPKFVDVYFRRGSMEVSSFPAVIGNEAAGIVEAVRRGVPAVKVGDRVVFGHRTGCRRTSRTQRSLFVGYTRPNQKRDSTSIANASIISSGNVCASG